MSTSDELSRIQFPGDGATIGGALAIPRHTPAPAVVLIPDVRGVSPLYCRLGARLAEAGILTLVLDIYSREGTPDLPDMEAVNRCIAALPDQRVLGDVAAAVRHLSERKDVIAQAIGVVGFCVGGQYAVMAACKVTGLRACVSFYGMLRYAERPPHKPESPLDMAAALGCPLLGLYGAEDALIPIADIHELEAVLARTGKRFEYEIYPGAGHAFLNDARPDAYRPEAAAHAWSRAVTFLQSELGAARTARE